MLLDYMNENKTYPLYDGYIRGNMFIDLYKPYKNYKVYNVKTNNKKEECLLELMMLEFAINDLNLYLIIHPEDQEVFKKYKNYIEIYKTKKDEYEKNYHFLNTDNEKDKYTYTSNPLPWEGRYV